MKRRTILLTLTGLCSLFALRAQELPYGIYRVRNRLSQTPFNIEQPQSIGTASDSLAWQLELVRQKIAQQRQREVIVLKNTAPVRGRTAGRTADRTAERTVQAECAKWEWRVTGNAGPNNWSPFPDRALDARVIRYPMSRSAAWTSPVKPSRGPAIRRFK